MRKEVKKLYEGKAEVRDFEVHQCMTKNESMTITHDGEKMTLSPEELLTRRVSISRTFETKIPGGKNYKLFGYIWEPDEVEL